MGRLIRTTKLIEAAHTRSDWLDLSKKSQSSPTGAPTWGRPNAHRGSLGFAKQTIIFPRVADGLGKTHLLKAAAFQVRRSRFVEHVESQRVEVAARSEKFPSRWAAKEESSDSAGL
jgi:hypothetical protein